MMQVACRAQKVVVGVLGVVVVSDAVVGNAGVNTVADIDVVPFAFCLIIPLMSLLLSLWLLLVLMPLSLLLLLLLMVLSSLLSLNK